MGGGPEEFLLIIFPDPEPTVITNRLRALYPHIHIHYHQLSRPSNSGKQMGGIPYSFDSIPNSLWAQATLLVTLGTLPSSQSLVPRLTLIHLLSAGVDHFAKHPIFTDSDIPVTTVSGIHGPPIAEWVVMTVLAITKKLALMRDRQREHRWDSVSPGLRHASDSYSKTVGIVGYGSIGRQVARVYRAMGSKIYAYTATAKVGDQRKDDGFLLPDAGDPDGSIPEKWYSGDTEGLHGFLASGLDVLVVCVPLTPSTRGMFGADEFEVLYQTALKRQGSTASDESIRADESAKLPSTHGTIIANISRGPVIDTTALITGLRDGKLAGAALDVTDPEPLPADSELWDMPNCVITPHISALGREYLSRGFDVLIENLNRRAKGEKLVNEVKRKRGY